MSTSFDQQRSKGQANQVSHGQNKEQVRESDFDGSAYMSNQGGYGNAQMSEYMSNYYSYGFVNQPTMADQGAWSTGADPMNFLPAYGQMGYDNSGMFGNFGQIGGYGPNFNSWELTGGDYTWGTGATGGRKGDEHAYADGGYYTMAAESYGVNGEMDRDMGMKAVEHGLKGVSISGDGKGDGQKDDLHHGKTHHGNGGGSTGSSSGAKKSWATIASQPAKPQLQVKPKTIPRAPLAPSKHNNMDIGTWEGRNSAAKQGQGRAWSAGRGRPVNPGAYTSTTATSSSNSGSSASTATNGNASAASVTAVSHPVLEELRTKNSYNPRNHDLNPKGARYFIIKSYSEDDIHRSIKYSIWCSTEHGNKRLDSAYREREGKGQVYLFFSVNGSGHFCGMAIMTSPIDYGSSAGVWAQDKWRGQFTVKWIYVKDVPNSQLRHIRLENNENKPVTNSRDTQEVPPEKGKQVLKIIHSYRHTTSIFDDFGHYEKRQEEDVPEPGAGAGPKPRNGNDDRGSRNDRGDRSGGSGRGRDRDRNN